MREENLKVGDLVVVVKPTECCGNGRSIGYIGRVTQEAHDLYVKTYCPHCKDEGPVVDEVKLDNGKCYRKSRLKRIPPLSELEGTKQTKELTA